MTKSRRSALISTTRAHAPIPSHAPHLRIPKGFRNKAPGCTRSGLPGVRHPATAALRARTKCHYRKNSAGARILSNELPTPSGLGWARREGGSIEEIRPGDIVWFPPGEKHWHGAQATTAMTHIAIAEALDGKVVEWLEHVSDHQYPAAS